MGAATHSGSVETKREHRTEDMNVDIKKEAYLSCSPPPNEERHKTSVSKINRRRRRWEKRRDHFVYIWHITCIQIDIRERERLTQRQKMPPSTHYTTPLPSWWRNTRFDFFFFLLHCCGRGARKDLHNLVYLILLKVSLLPYNCCNHPLPLPPSPIVFSWRY
jgi:hypothetical protein